MVHFKMICIIFKTEQRKRIEWSGGQWGITFNVVVWADVAVKVIFERAGQTAGLSLTQEQHRGGNLEAKHEYRQCE